jgi:demethylmenaquinone methyltransferase / 2-methoxy-6-polyprenyl-1,4-benzoquinol methylase
MSVLDLSKRISKVENSAARDPEAVREMFGRVARRYDLANHVLSLGVDFFWRARAARQVEKWKAESILDLATGSGDLALAIERRLPTARIVGADFSPKMIQIAHNKGVRETIIADALRLPFADQSFDCVTIAFGLRNVADWGVALIEMARVLTASGHVLILDFSIPRSILRGPYRFYLHHFLPKLAGLLTSEKDAYDYLAASIEEFPSGNEMLQLIEANGFINAHEQPMTGGIVTMYTAKRESVM